MSRLRQAACFTGIGVLVACGAADRPTPIGTTSQAASTPFTISVTLPTGTSIVDTTVGAAGSVSLGSRSKTLGPTASGSGGVEVQSQATSLAITSGGAVTVDSQGVVNGNVTAHGAITIASGGAIHGTQAAQSATTVPLTTTWSVVNPGNSQGGITLQNNAIAAPVPGVYDAVVVNAGSKLYLSSGTYFFTSLDLESGANLVVDSRSGPVFLYLSSTLIYRGSEKDGDGGIPQLFVGYFGTNAAILEAPFYGVFLAPNAQLHLENAQAAGNIGTFYGQSFVADAGEIIQPGTFDWTQVPGMPTPPGGWAANGGGNGTGTAGSGATGGGTGNGGAPVTSASSPTAQINFHIVSPDGNAPQTATQSSSTPVPFHVPTSFDVGGELANGTVSVVYTSTAGAVVTCTFQGGSSSATPTTTLDQELGRTATFVGCSDGQPASTLRFGTSFTVTVNPAPGLPVTLNLPLDDRGCTQNFDLLTPYQTRLMHDTFNWSNATTVPLNTDGTPTLFYAWVYLHNTSDLLTLRKLYVHILSRPLFTQELEPFAGKCGTFINPGDGTGVFVPVLMPGEVYNVLVNVQSSSFRKANNIQDPVPPATAALFDAVILRKTDVPAAARNANGAINFNVLKSSGFRYLDYEGPTPPPQASMVQSGGAVSVVLQDITSFVLNAVRTVGQTITNALGDLDAIFAGRVTFRITLSAANYNTGFGQTNAMTRAWGPLGGQPLGAAGLEVSLLENFLEILPETFVSYTDDNGFVGIRPAQHSGNARGSGICVHLSNDAAWQTSFLMPNDLCDLNGFDTSEVPPGSPQLVSDSLSISDFSQDRTIDWFAQDRQLNTMYQATDAHKYVHDVLQFSTATAHVLVGDMADALTSVQSNRAFTHCFHLRNENAAQIQNLLSGYINNLGYAAFIDAASVVGGTFANTDIIMPDASADGTVGNGGREAGSHEYGHFTFCNVLLGGDNTAIDNLIGSTVFNGGNDLNNSTRYINEAFADFISGQVTSDANYAWLDPNREGQNGKVCIAAPCFDENFDGTPTGSQDKAGIARISSLLFDAFDGPNAKGLAVPDEADGWISDSKSGDFVYTPTTYGNTDGANVTPGTLPQCRLGTGPGFTVPGSSPPQQVPCVGSEAIALPGGAMGNLGALIAQNGSPGGGNYLSDGSVYKALDRAMTNAGYNWCQRCALFALHTPANGSDALGPGALFQQCAGGDTLLNSIGVPSGSPPEPSLRLDASTCTPCPAGQVSDANGVCQVCNGIVEGNACVQCPSDVTIDGNVAPLGLQSWDTTMNHPSNDVCPDWFWVEVDNPQGFFARGATSLSGEALPSPITQQLCQMPFTVAFQDFPTGGVDFMTEQSLTQTGVFSGSGLVVCTNLPQVSVSSSQLTFGTSPVRFGAKVGTGVLLDFDAFVPPPPPP